MDRDEVRREWDEISESYAESRDPTGSDADLIDDLRSAVENVSVHRLKRVDSHQSGNRQKFVTLDLYELTEKQRQAVTAAVAAGYYEAPREISLGELADRIDISKSALSQRLKAAESKLVTSAFSRASIQ